ncbi:hypothetical protein D3C73_1438490 [compost metagenome]
MIGSARQNGVKRESSSGKPNCNHRLTLNSSRYHTRCRPRQFTGWETTAGPSGSQVVLVR